MDFPSSTDFAAFEKKQQAVSTIASLSFNSTILLLERQLLFTAASKQQHQRRRFARISSIESVSVTNCHLCFNLVARGDFLLLILTVSILMLCCNILKNSKEFTVALCVDIFYEYRNKIFEAKRQ